MEQMEFVETEKTTRASRVSDRVKKFLGMDVGTKPSAWKPPVVVPDAVPEELETPAYPSKQNYDLSSYLNIVSKLESDGNPLAKNPKSTASGEFQFTDSTWKSYTKEMGVDWSPEDRFDRDKSKKVMEYSATKDLNSAKKILGRDPDYIEHYMFHKLGFNEGKKFLENLKISPDTVVTKFLRKEVIDANKNVYLNKDGSAKTVKDVYNNLKDRAGISRHSIENPTNYGNRKDGSTKGKGFLGELKRPDGKVSTELSIGVNFDGKQQEIPMLVPTLTKQEIDYLLNDGKPTDAIVKKAVEHARKRVKEGKPVFSEK